MTGMQRLMEELRRHAADYERATDPDSKRRALRRFRIASVIGFQDLFRLHEEEDDTLSRALGAVTTEIRIYDGDPGDEPSGVARPGSEQETETRSRATSYTVTRTVTHSGSSHSVGTSVSVGSCPDCGGRPSGVEGQSTTRTIGVGRSHGHSITGSKGVSTTPEPHTRGENELSADGRDCDSATE